MNHNNDMEMEVCPCPVCTEDNYRQLYQVKGYNIVKCFSCSMVYVNPRMKNEEVYNLYKKNYFQNNEKGYGYENYDVTEHLRIMTFQRWYDEMKPYLLVNPGSALDVGCASGNFLTLLSENGWDARGIELDQDINKKVKEKGFEVADAPLEHYETSLKFHLITLFDVIEHLPYLNRNLEILSKILADNGTIALVTPDIGSLQRKLFGNKWFQFKPKEHIYYFSEKTLKQVIEPYGLKIVQIWSSGQYADFGFLHHRLIRYGFSATAAILKLVTSILGLKDKSWYAGTGSMFVIIQKTKVNSGALTKPIN